MESIRYPLTEIRVCSFEVGQLQLLKSLGEKFREEEHTQNPDLITSQ